MRIKITNNGYPTVTISKLDEGKMLYAEINSMIACSTDLERSLCLANGASYTVPERHTPIGRFFANRVMEAKQAINREATNERSYVLFKAKKNDQKVTLKSCFPGMIMAWNTEPMLSDQVYDVTLSVFSHSEEEYLHGTIIAVRGAFLAAEMSVRMDVYKTNNIRVTSASKTGGIFQHFSGSGTVFLEAHGDLIEIPLYPFESVDVWPGNLFAFTEGIDMKMHVSSDINLRGAENEKEVIRLTAPAHGGFVYVQSVADIELPVLTRDNAESNDN